MKKRKLLNWVAPALAVGVILVSGAQAARFQAAPQRPVWTMAPTSLTRAYELQAEQIFNRINADTTREQALITAQNRAFQAGNQALVRAYQTVLNRNAIFLNLDKTVLIPIKDHDLQVLGNFSARYRQVFNYVTAATVRESQYVRAINAYLSRTPLTVVGF